MVIVRDDVATDERESEEEFFGIFSDTPRVRYRKEALNVFLVFLIVLVVLSTGNGAFSLLLSRNPLTVMTAQRPLARPTTLSCMETIVRNQTFSPSSNQPYIGKYASPTRCPRPWAMVVLDWNGTSPISQYDHVGALWLGKTEILRTITPETSGVSWHVEKDVTKYALVFSQAQNVTAIVSVPSGIIIVNASLTFYESSFEFGPSPHADIVIPVASDSPIPWVRLDTGQSTQVNFSLPRNALRAYMEVYATAHNCDETWFSSNLVPNSSCQGSNPQEPFREIRILIDGRLAGLAWPFPYIYTGGLNTNSWNFWESIPAVNALNIPPYQTDLTPFVGLIDDGMPHQIAIQIANNHGYWLVDGNLFVYQDHGSQMVSGNLTTYKIPSNPLEQTTSFGLVYTRANRTDTVVGYLDTSLGRITVAIQQIMVYVNAVLPNLFMLSMELRVSTIMATTTTITAPNGTVVKTTFNSYGVTVREGLPKSRLGLFTSVIIDQSLRHADLSTSKSNVTSIIEVSDLIHAEVWGATSENYLAADSSGYCYHRFLSASRGGITLDQKLDC